MKRKKKLYSIQLPATVFDLFQQRVMDYHFYGVGDVMNYLMDSYCRRYRGEKVSRNIERIFHFQDEGWYKLFRYNAKAIFAFETSITLADEMSRISSELGYNRRNRLNHLIIGAFISSSHATLRNLSREMDVRDSATEIKSTLIATYVSNYQYAFLRETADEQNTSIGSLLSSVADIFIQLDNDSTETYIPKDIRKIAERVLLIEGCTTKEFRRCKTVAVSVGNKSDAIFQFMQRRRIKTPREFLRRVILFFLEAKYLLYKKEISCSECFADCEESTYEDYMNDQYAKKDFVRSLYM